MKTVPVLLALVLATIAAAPASAKSADGCAAEYRANKAKLEGTQTEADFMAACEVGQAPVAGATSAAIPAVPPATAAHQPATPASAAGQAPGVP